MKAILTKKAPWYCALLLASTPALAQDPAAPPSSLPVKQVTLFTSGVSYTERAGDIDGNASVPLLFRTAQINDILKSMVLYDATGTVQPATYAARDPVGHSLQSFAVDVADNLTQEQVLTRLRGASVSIETPGKPAITGQIVGVEQRDVAGADGKPIKAAYVNLLTSAGLTSVRLDADITVHLLDERLNKEFQAALTTLATNTDQQRRQVMLHFAGVGRREVRVGYVTEAPLWKMSYRLALGGMAPRKPGAKPYIQGWALVENTSDDDWSNVRLSLVSGRPISFIQDLYQPLYIPRPVVGPDVVASPYPQTHGEALERDVAAKAPGGMGGFGGGLGEGGGGGPVGEAGPAAAAGPGRNYQGGFRSAASAIVGESITAMAAGQKAGELFQYNISTPITLTRQQSAMIPVVSKDIEADKVSLYNYLSGLANPVNAVRIHNTTGMHLKGGPVTLFDDGVYAGDARMEDIPPGDTRLISYAVDLGVEVGSRNNEVSNLETAFSLRHGILRIERRETHETTYTLKSKSDKPRTVLVEHPFSSEFKLVSPAKAEERTADFYRFAVEIAPGKTQTLKIVEARPLNEMFGVVEGAQADMVAYMGRSAMSPKLRAVLQEVIKRRRDVEELNGEAASRAAEEQSISADQERIRKNMMALDKSSALYKRYVGELDEQETKIETIRKDALRLKAAAAAATAGLSNYLDGMGAVD